MYPSRWYHEGMTVCCMLTRYSSSLRNQEIIHNRKLDNKLEYDDVVTKYFIVITGICSPRDANLNHWSKLKIVDKVEAQQAL